MALQLNKTLDRGVVATECYAKISKADYIKGSNLDDEFTGIRLTVVYYFNADARVSNSMNHIQQEQFVVEDGTVELRADQYAYLKTLDDFAGATDV